MSYRKSQARPYDLDLDSPDASLLPLKLLVQIVSVPTTDLKSFAHPASLCIPTCISIGTFPVIAFPFMTFIFCRGTLATLSSIAFATLSAFASVMLSHPLALMLSR